jgi:hypothetical protein
VATVTKLFAFAASAEGFVATQGANSTLTWDSTTGNPAGALKARITGRSKSNANWWAYTGTWESLGVPVGATVTAIRVSAAYTRCTEYTTGASSTIGPYELRDNGGVLQATLWTGRTVTAVDAAWVAVPAQTDQAVPSGLQASGSTVQIRLADTLATGASSSAAVSSYDDQVSLVITYTASAVTGTASLSGDGTLTAQAAPTIGSAPSLSGDGTLTSQGKPASSGLAGLSGDGTLTATGVKGGAAATFSGAGSLTVTGTVEAFATLSGNGQLTVTTLATPTALPAFSGAGTLSTSTRLAVVAQAALSGDGQLVTQALTSLTGAVSLSGAGMLTVSGRAPTSPGLYAGIAQVTLYLGSARITALYLGSNRLV